MESGKVYQLSNRPFALNYSGRIILKYWVFVGNYNLFSKLLLTLNDRPGRKYFVIPLFTNTSDKYLLKTKIFSGSMYSSCFVLFDLVKCFLNRNFIINHKSHFVGLRVLKLLLFVLLCEPYVMKDIFVVHRLDQTHSWTWSVVVP